MIKIFCAVDFSSSMSWALETWSLHLKGSERIAHCIFRCLFSPFIKVTKFLRPNNRKMKYKRRSLRSRQNDWREDSTLRNTHTRPWLGTLELQLNNASPPTLQTKGYYRGPLLLTVAQHMSRTFIALCANYAVLATTRWQRIKWLLKKAPLPLESFS